MIYYFKGWKHTETLEQQAVILAVRSPYGAGLGVRWVDELVRAKARGIAKNMGIFLTGGSIMRHVEVCRFLDSSTVLPLVVRHDEARTFQNGF